MGRIIQGGLRGKEHTITDAGGTFSIAPSENHTDGTWTKYDLYQSEIGVNNTDKRVYIRLNDEIREFDLVYNYKTTVYSDGVTSLVTYDFTEMGISTLNLTVNTVGSNGTSSYSSLKNRTFWVPSGTTSVTTLVNRDSYENWSAALAGANGISFQTGTASVSVNITTSSFPESDWSVIIKVNKT